MPKINVNHKQYFQYWGKLNQNPDGMIYHPLVYHSLDVAAVGYCLAKSMLIARDISKRIGCDETDLLNFVTFLCAIHDIGKFSDGFQNLKPDIVKALRGISLNAGYREKHWSSGYRFLCEYADIIFKKDKDTILDIFESWLSACSGHHGCPPKNEIISMPISSNFPELVRKDIFDFITDIQKLFLNSDHLVDLSLKPDILKEISWSLAGLIVLADWIGSNSDWFQYEQPEKSLEEYYKIALQRAKRAVIESGVLPCKPSETKNLKKIFKYIANPTPLQSFAEIIPIKHGPNLFIIEEITGAGKTEAALMLAHRIISNKDADGIYFGLPTMATANAMHSRVEDIFHKFYTNESRPVLILAHSASRQYFAMESKKTEFISKDYDDNAEQESQAWLYDNKKKALLADVGVGTIDQALLSVLNTRHQSLRLLGLNRKVLIVDEVHAYDSYMNKLLCNLLTFHAAQGGTAVLLSATLPLKLKKNFISSFAEGQKLDFDMNSKLSNEYPLITGIIDSKFTETSVESPSHLHKTVTVNTVNDETCIFDYISNILNQGKNICWIRNTVFDAQKSYYDLCEKFGDDKVTLFHARFTLGDRLSIEKELIKNYGSDSGEDSRKEKIIIATQVIEQSLDIDFDCMISDLAPIDLIIQRTGRLCRHSRDKHGNRIEEADQRGNPEIVVYMPSLDGNIKSEWYSSKFPKAAYVYEHHGRLWLTAKWLLDNKKFRMPQDARNMIEYVYGAKNQVDIPEKLEYKENMADGSDKAKTGYAQIRSLNISSGYMPDMMKWVDDEKVETRIGNPTTKIRLAIWKNGCLIPLYNNNEETDWILSELSVSKYYIATETEEYQKDIEEVKKSMPDKGKYSVVIPMKYIDDMFIGSANNTHNHKVKVLYDRKSGLRVNQEGDNNESY